MSALPLITVTDDGEFIFHEEAAELLQSSKCPISLVAIAGLYRTGKSYLMNVLTGNYKGFTVGSTVNACTKGIWIWSIPKHDEEKNTDTYFIDTEGLGSTSRSSTHDSRIFALALLISSFFVYNSRGVIDGQAIEDLSLVTNLTQVIQAKSSDKNSDGSSLAEFFPSFLWIVRDFTLKLVDENGTKISSSQYLENCLRPQQGFTESIVSKNRIRELICSFFRDRDCITMVRPAEDEEVLRDLSSQPFDSLRPEFQKQIKLFQSKVESSTRPKQMMGRTLNGEMMATLIRSYTNALNSGGVPVISSAWERVLANQCQEAKATAIEVFEKELKSRLEKESLRFNKNASFPIPEDVLGNIFNSSKAASKSTFWSKINEVDDEKVIETSRKLKEELRDRYLKLEKDNLEASQKSSDEYVLSLIGTMINKSSAAAFSIKPEKTKVITPNFEEMKKILAEIESNLDLAVKTTNSQVNATVPYFGASMTGSLNKALASKLLDEIVAWGGSVAESFRLSGESLQYDLDLINRDIDSLKSKLATKSTLLEQQVKNSKRSIQSVKDLTANENRRHESDVTRKDTEISRYDKMYTDLMNMHNQSIGLMKEREVSLRKKLEDMKLILIEEEKKLTGNAYALKNEAQSLQKSRSDDASNLEKSIEEQEKKIADLESQLAKIDSEFERANQTQSVQNNLALNKEKAAQKRALEAEKAQLDSDEKEEEEIRAENLKKLQALITDKSVQLLNLKETSSATRFANPMYSNDSTGSRSSESTNKQSDQAPKPSSNTDQWGNTAKPKKKSGCKQS